MVEHMDFWHGVGGLCLASSEVFEIRLYRQTDKIRKQLECVGHVRRRAPAIFQVGYLRAGQLDSDWQGHEIEQHPVQPGARGENILEPRAVTILGGPKSADGRNSPSSEIRAACFWTISRSRRWCEWLAKRPEKRSFNGSVRLGRSQSSRASTARIPAHSSLSISRCKDVHSSGVCSATFAQSLQIFINSKGAVSSETGASVSLKQGMKMAEVVSGGRFRTGYVEFASSDR
uniref:Uncharacterized protein n=1 Tax=Mycena chlorophos TaxID=658473 RepID=A0ABQ0M2R8_MYCCL|nr:predicted protein [Mycena chlorophos]